MKRVIFWLLPILFIITGLSTIALIYFPVARQEIVYQIKKQNNQPVQVIDNPHEAEKIIQEQKQPGYKMQPATLIPKSFDFSLVIPMIGVNSLVFPEVDSANEKEYKEFLKKGVAQARGSSLPDQPGPVFIFGHSTDSFYNITQYNAAFFLLPKLAVGDEILVFYKQQKYSYHVAETKTVTPEEITDIVKSEKGNSLILQTCYPPGTTLKRYLVIAR